MYKNKLIVISVLLVSNNIFYSISNIKGEVLFWTSSGVLKLKGAKKISTTTISFNIKNVKDFLKSLNYKYVLVKIKGFNKNKKNLVKVLKQSVNNIILIYEKTSFSHNGCKKSKIRYL